MNKITILMPAFNEELFVREAVESVAHEISKNNIELIVVDDFSTDNTWTVLNELKAEYEFIKIYKNEIKGKNSAFNLAYKKSTGDIIILLAADDILEAGMLSVRTSPLLENNNITITCCKLKTFSKKKKLDSIVTPKSKDKGALSGGTIAFKRDFADKVFPIPEILANEDMWINCHINYFNNIEIFHIPKIGLKYRLHSNNSLKRDVSFELSNNQVHKRSIVYSVFLEKYRNSLSGDNINKLARQASLEQLRWDGSVLSIVFFKKINMTDKLRAILYSNSFFYSFYRLFYRWIIR